MTQPTPIYVETSAWAKLIKEEPGSGAFAAFADSHLDAGARFVSSLLLYTELHRLAKRFAIDPTVASRALSQVDLFVPEPSVFRTAGILGGPTVRSLDALHIAHCLDLGLTAMATYDERQAEAARSVGITVIAPGA